jgi:hypothetical protein
MFTGIATGFLGAAIKDKEAKDNLRMKIAESAGIDYLTKDKPEHEKKQKLYEADYKNVAEIYGTHVANYFGSKTGIFGDGQALNTVSNIMDKYNLDEESLKKMTFSTFDERQAERESKFQSKEDQIKNLTGIGGLGVETVKNQLEGFGETKTTDVAPSETTDVAQATNTEQKVSTDIGSLWSKKQDTRGVETKFKQIPIAINEKYGYGENIKMEDGTYKFQPTGTMAKTANAHIALAEIISSQDNSINQYGAADQAKNMLVNLTEMPFISLEQTLGGKYEAGDGSKTALIKGVGNINANEIQYNGQSVAEYLVDFVMNQIPVDPQGNINKAVIDKFIENIPSNLMYSKDESVAERLDRTVKETNFFKTFG